MGGIAFSRSELKPRGLTWETPSVGETVSFSNRVVGYTEVNLARGKLPSGRVAYSGLLIRSVEK